MQSICAQQRHRQMAGLAEPPNTQKVAAKAGTNQLYSIALEELSCVFTNLPVVSWKNMVHKLDDSNFDERNQLGIQALHVLHHHVIDFCCYLNSCGTASNNHKRQKPPLFLHDHFLCLHCISHVCTDMHSPPCFLNVTMCSITLLKLLLSFKSNCKSRQYWTCQRILFPKRFNLHWVQLHQARSTSKQAKAPL